MPCGHLPRAEAVRSEVVSRGAGVEKTVKFWWEACWLTHAFLKGNSTLTGWSVPPVKPLLSFPDGDLTLSPEASREYVQ